MSKPFATYEKNIEARLVRTKHIVRPTLNMSVGQLIYILQDVPAEATLSMIIGDDETDVNYPIHGELIFEEEQQQD